MIGILKLSAVLVWGYLVGSLNTAVIVEGIYGKGIRKHESKNGRSYQYFEGFSVNLQRYLFLLEIH
jgi:hypothetical protein